MPAGSKYWIEEGTLSAELKNVDVDGEHTFDYYFFTIKNHCLHAKHPLGWMRKVRVWVDGEEIRQQRAFFVIRGQWISLKHLPTITDIWWNLAEEAQIFFEHPDKLKPGLHRIKCRIEMSLHVNTRTVDVQDHWPRLFVDVETEMRVG